MPVEVATITFPVGRYGRSDSVNRPTWTIGRCPVACEHRSAPNRAANPHRNARLASVRRSVCLRLLRWATRWREGWGARTRTPIPWTKTRCPGRLDDPPALPRIYQWVRAPPSRGLPARRRRRVTGFRHSSIAGRTHPGAVRFPPDSAPVVCHRDAMRTTPTSSGWRSRPVIRVRRLDVPRRRHDRHLLPSELSRPDAQARATCASSRPPRRRSPPASGRASGAGRTPPPAPLSGTAAPTSSGGRCA